MTLKILLVSREEECFSGIKAGFDEKNITSSWAETGGLALSGLDREKYDLVLVHEALADMNARQFVEKLLEKNPMLNCAVLSGLGHDDFHEAYEGLGVLMQLPLTPGQEDFHKLMAHIDTIAGIMSRSRTAEKGA